MEKALAILHNPKSLLDFLWYYEAYGKKKYEYDVLTLYFGKDAEGNWKNVIDEFVCNSGVFNDIIKFDASNIYEDKKIWQKILYLINFFKVYLFKQQYEFSKKDLNKLFEVNKYNQIIKVFLPDIMSGEIVNLGRHKEVILLEDGERDYDCRRSRPTLKSIRKEGLQKEMAGFILSHLGIADPVTQYKFSPLKNCVKFSSFPHRIENNVYKKVLTLNDMSVVDAKHFSQLVAKTFALDRSVFEEEINYVVFTAPLAEHIDKSYVDVFYAFLEESKLKGNFLLKRHPRDNSVYRFPEGICVYEVPSLIPAEIFLDRISESKCFFFWPSTLISVMKNSQKDIFTLMFKDYCNAKYSVETVRHDLGMLGIPQSQLICF